jgi:hypothetical protein
MDFKIDHTDFNLACAKLWVHGGGIARNDFALNANDAFSAQMCQAFKVGIGRSTHNLGNAIMVAQIDERDPAMVAATMDPARDGNSLANMVSA